MHAKIIQCLTFFIFITFITLVLSNNHEVPNRRFKRQYNPFDPDFGRKLSESIQRSVNQQLRQNMEFIDAINSNVQTQLAPVHRMQLRNRMAQGYGGVTIIHYGDKIRFVTDGVVFVCPSNQVVQNDTGPPKCTQELVLDKFNDPCTFSGVGISMIGNFYCFGHNVIMSCVDNNCTCQGGRVYSVDQLKTLCGPSFGSNTYATYTYYPDIMGVNAVEYNSASNQQLHLCDSMDEYSCTWSDFGIALPTNG